MAVDITGMSRKDLEKLQKDIEKALALPAKTERKEARKAAEKAAAKFGFTLSELTGSTTKSRKSDKGAAPKYANPDDGTQTWSGRGRQPQWFKDAISAGTAPEKMEI